jgi:hypothetical protein
MLSFWEMIRLLLAHKSDLMLDDWPDEAIIAASTGIVRTLEKCAVAARQTQHLTRLVGQFRATESHNRSLG